MSEWRDDLPDDIRDNGELKNYDSVEKLARRTIELRQKLSSAINIPGEGASDEELEGFGKRLREKGFSPSDPVPEEGYANGGDLRPLEGEAGDTWLADQQARLKKAGIGEKAGRTFLENERDALSGAIDAFKEADEAAAMPADEATAAMRGAKALGFDDLMNVPLMTPDGKMISLSHKQGLTNMLKDYAGKLGEDGTKPPDNSPPSGTDDIAELQIEYDAAMQAWVSKGDSDLTRKADDDKVSRLGWKLSRAKRGLPAAPYPGREAIGKELLRPSK